MTAVAEIVVHAAQVMLILLIVAFFVVGEKTMSGGKKEGNLEGLAVKTIYVVGGMVGFSAIIVALCMFYELEGG